MYKLFIGALTTLFLLPAAMAQNPEAIFDQLLRDSVSQGHVDYRGLTNDKRLQSYIKYISGFDPETFASKAERLSFWINAYNAYTLKIIADNYPLKSIKGLKQSLFKGGKSVWDQKFVVVNNETITLNYIEHKIIRSKFKDPRIHFALVCAAKGCPALRSEAFSADKLDYQLDEQARRFLSENKKNSFNLSKKEAKISPIFKWYLEDFAKDKQGLLLYISQFLPQKISRSIRESAGRWKIKYSFYDWALNE